MFSLQGKDFQHFSNVKASVGIKYKAASFKAKLHINLYANILWIKKEMEKQA